MLAALSIFYGDVFATCCFRVLVVRARLFGTKKALVSVGYRGDCFLIMILIRHVKVEGISALQDNAAKMSGVFGESSISE